MQLTPDTLIALVGGTGAGAVVDRAARRFFGRRRENVDVAKLSVETIAQVLVELRAELADTRAELGDTRATLARAEARIEELSSALSDAHAETEELRAELADARRELAALSARGDRT